MKKIIITMFVSAIVFNVSAQSEKFTKAMQANFTKLEEAKSADDFLSLSASFERIGTAEKNQWLPFYYSAYTQLLHGFIKQDANAYDNIADKATALLGKVDSLQANNSEISCIRSMIATLHLIANPMQRYMEYGPLSSQALEQAKKQDPTNPRPYFLEGQTLKNTPEQFGGGCGAAKPTLQKAITLYDAFKPASELYPNWGRKQTQELLDGCK